jgi:hypothetical protein
MKELSGQQIRRKPSTHLRTCWDQNCGTECWFPKANFIANYRIKIPENPGIKKLAEKHGDVLVNLLAVISKGEGQMSF